MFEGLKKKSPLLTPAEFEALTDGDDKVFQKVFEAYVGLIQFVVGKFRLSSDTKDDIVQEVFVKLYENRRKLTGANTIKAWLCTTARNLCIDQTRRKPTTSFEDAQESGQELAPQAAGPDSAVREAEVILVQELIDKVVEQTGDDTFRLFYSEGMSAKDIAIMKEEAVSTVTTRLSRLRKRFRDEFRQHVEALRAQFPGGN